MLDSPPILPDQHESHATHPPEIRSYVYRLWLFGNLPPVSLASWLKEDRRKTEAKIALNEKILSEIVAELMGRGLDFRFVVFHPAVTGNLKLDARTDWRETFLRRFPDDNEIAYIWSKETAARQSKVKHPRLADFMTNNNHPTTFFNELLANEMKAMVLRRGRRAAPVGPRAVPAKPLPRIEGSLAPHLANGLIRCYRRRRRGRLY